MLARLVPELLTSGDLPSWASQSAGITDVSHHAQPAFSVLFFFSYIITKCFYMVLRIIAYNGCIRLSLYCHKEIPPTLLCFQSSLLWAFSKIIIFFE